MGQHRTEPAWEVSTESAMPLVDAGTETAPNGKESGRAGGSSQNRICRVVCRDGKSNRECRHGTEKARIGAARNGNLQKEAHKKKTPPYHFGKDKGREDAERTT